MTLQDFIKANQGKMNEIEQTFVEDVFYPYAGENGLDYLRAQTPFEDSVGRKNNKASTSGKSTPSLNKSTVNKT